MVEEPPFAIILHNTVVGSPADYRSQDLALVGEWSVWAVAYCVAEMMGIACRVALVIFSIIFMHQAGLEETTVIVACCERFAVFVEDDDRLRLLRKLEHVV